jgi:hypothetical protein
MPHDAAVPPQKLMLDLLSGSWKAQAVYAAAKLGLADMVKDGPRSSTELAQATGTHPPSLYRLLRGLASVGVFAEEDGKFRLTPMAACLCSGSPGSQRSLAIMMGEEHFGSWGDLLYSLRTGKPAFDHVFGQPIFQYLAQHPEQAAVFDDAMVGVHGTETAAMLDAYDFSVFGTLIDVGGGNGSLLTGVLQRNPKLKGILYDQPHVVERARPALRTAGLEGRCQVIGGDFFASVPSGGDAYLMRHIIHDWDDARSLVILGHCRKAMSATARLLLIESVIPPGNEPFFGKFLDLNMLVIPGGQERTESEYRELLGKAGFRLARIVPTRTEISVIESVPM